MDQNSNLSYRSEQALTVSRSTGSYGYADASAVPGRPREAVVPGPTVALRTRFLTAEIFGLLFVALSALFIFAVPSIITRREQMTAMINRVVKRGMDILGALTGIIICLPVLVVFSILIKFDSRGPVFYTQTRIGRDRRKGTRRYHQRSEVACQRTEDRRKENLHGRPFRVVKFRTMVQDAERKSGPVWASKNDPRVTRLGRFMRKTRIDEIPQFFNVLIGDMSLVGPRPERPKFVGELSEKVEGYTERLQVKPGITGLAQVESGYDTSLESVIEKVGYDVAYIRSMSVWHDIKILAKTVVVVTTGKGAH